MADNKKVYLFATMYGDKMRFSTHDWEMYWFWAGWNETQPKFIISALVDLYWPEEWLEVYEKFNNALLEVSKNEHFNKPTACITLYSRD